MLLFLCRQCELKILNFMSPHVILLVNMHHFCISGLQHIPEQIRMMNYNVSQGKTRRDFYICLTSVGKIIASSIQELWSFSV